MSKRESFLTGFIVGLIYATIFCAIVLKLSSPPELPPLPEQTRTSQQQSVEL